MKDREIYYECPFCHHVQIIEKPKKANSCPKCGTNMIRRRG